MAVTRQPFPDPHTPGGWRTQPGPNMPNGPVGGNPGRPLDSWQGPMITQPFPTASNSNVNLNVSTRNRNSFMDSIRSPEALAALGMGGLGLASNLLGNRAQGQ